MPAMACQKGHIQPEGYPRQAQAALRAGDGVFCVLVSVAVFRYRASSCCLLCVDTGSERLFRSTNDETGFCNHAANRFGLMAGRL